ncbi:ImmA/IrrE family metallo-endopeptidase [Paraliomyxa miuraensis]|uniref:ImmA/IrrE family metallo-endopeptidase n=1 Tax=Paraliomyxa miuraensis TaxID=376150 RepID=UPI00224D7C14|nr:ImmA/IrrE family metallo-endopeptidase [Paraliomyxa miuraensis]MCX4239488.1 ImmA/IrrE family metallo-endopeptidase [Paraliomyxa miuraensis]
MSSPRTPQQAANHLLQKFGVESPQDIEINGLAEECKATIVYEPLRGCDGRVLGNGERAIITVASDRSPGRQRFSAAHELGHWIYDRGHVDQRLTVAERCSDILGKRSWEGPGREQRADRFAAELLLPDWLFIPACENQPTTLDGVSALATIFGTSLTATALRLIERGTRPAVLVTQDENLRRKWFRFHSDLPDRLRLLDAPMAGAGARRLSDTTRKVGDLVDASCWFDVPRGSGYEVLESSRRFSDGRTLTLLCWDEDEQMLLDLADDE